MFRIARPRDVHLACGVGMNDGLIHFDIDGYSGFNKAGLGPGDNAVDRSRLVPCRRLDSILDDHLPPGQSVDFLSVDCEGADLEVLESNDWQKYRPKFICVEDFAWREGTSATAQFLVAKGYAAFGQAGPSTLWERLSD